MKIMMAESTTCGMLIGVSVAAPEPSNRRPLPPIVSCPRGQGSHRIEVSDETETTDFGDTCSGSTRGQLSDTCERCTAKGHPGKSLIESRNARPREPMQRSRRKDDAGVWHCRTGKNSTRCFPSCGPARDCAPPLPTTWRAHACSQRSR